MLATHGRFPIALVGADDMMLKALSTLHGWAEALRAFVSRMAPSAPAPEQVPIRGGATSWAGRHVVPCMPPIAKSTWGVSMSTAGEASAPRSRGRSRSHYTSPHGACISMSDRKVGALLSSAVIANSMPPFVTAAAASGAASITFVPWKFRRSHSSPD